MNPRNYAIRSRLTSDFMHKHGDVYRLNSDYDCYVIDWHITMTNDPHIPIASPTIGPHNGKVLWAHVQSGAMLMPNDWYQVRFYEEHLEKMLNEDRIEFVPLSEAPPTQRIALTWKPTEETSSLS